MTAPEDHYQWHPDRHDLIPLGKDKRPLAAGYFGKNKCRSMELEEISAHLDKELFIGRRTGLQDSGLYLVVVDCDMAEGVDGIKAYTDHLKQNEMRRYLDTYTVETPSGGRHYYYWVTKEKYTRKFRNRVRMLPGVDVRAEGGYVVIPFSQVMAITYDNGTVQSH